MAKKKSKKDGGKAVSKAKRGPAEESELADSLFLIDPSGANPASGTPVPAGPTLSFSRTPTVLLTFAANRFTRSASRVYQDRFGIGAMDWRMLVMLMREPGSSVSHASRTIGIDKAAVSRSLQRLEKRGLATPEVVGGDERRKDWRLTPAGRALHDRVLELALVRQKALLNGFSREEIAAFTGYLSRFLENLEHLNVSSTD